MTSTGSQGPINYLSSLNTRSIGLLAGPITALLLIQALQIEGLSQTGVYTAAVAIWMAIWWATEAVPVAATALLPLILFPLLQLMALDKASAAYGNPTIFLFLGGFILSTAIQKSGLHLRIAFTILNAVNHSGGAIILSFAVASAFLSMWISNTSTTLMLLPVALSVAAGLSELSSQLSEKEFSNFKLNLMLAIAYGATFGGISTIVGTPPNAFLIAYLKTEHQISLGFAEWMLATLPLTLVFIALFYFLTTRVLFPVSFSTPQEVIRQIKQHRRNLGVMSGTERRVAIVFLLVVFAWITQGIVQKFVPSIALSDTVIALIGAMSLFIIGDGNANDRQRLLTWSDLRDIPWDVLILFGGGLCLAAAFSSSGLAQWLGSSLASLHSAGLLLLVLGATTLIIFMTEMTSNVATTATFLPVASAIALQIGVDPLMLAIPITLAASCAFMLPVATPPNAIIFASGHITIAQMMKAGFVLNMIGILLVTAVGYFWVPLVLNR